MGGCGRQVGKNNTFQHEREDGFCMYGIQVHELVVNGGCRVDGGIVGEICSECLVFANLYFITNVGEPLQNVGV